MPQILFFCKAPMNAAMFERPLRRLWERPRWRPRFAGEGRGYGQAAEIVRAMGFDGARQASGLAQRWKKWDAYISPDMTLAAPRAKRRIQIFHGVSFKGKMYTPPIRRFTDLFLIGADMRRRFIARGLYEEGDPALHNVGMTKLDAFFDGSLDRAAILREAGADPARPAVLYAPTWRPESSLYGEGMAFMKAAARREGWTLLVKLHDWAWDPATNPVNWARAIPELEGPRLRFLRGKNIVPYLYAADALVSDASSAANEYLLLDRPIVWLDAPELIKKYEQTIDLDGWGRKTGRIAAKAGELIEAVDHALAQPDEFGEVRRDAARDMFFNPGKATDVFVKTLEGLVGG